MKKLIFTLLALCACEATWAVGYNQTEWADTDRDAATVYTDSQTGLSFYVLDGSAVLTYAEASSSNYSSLTSLTLPETVSDGTSTYTVTKVGDYAFDHASNIKGELVVPANILTLGRSAFEGCTGITAVTIDYAETALGNSNNQNWGTPFYSCSGITTVTLNRDLTQGRGVTSGYRTELFSDLTNIETVYIGENVTDILHDLFNCNSSSSCKLATVYCYAATVPTLGSGAFDSHTGLTLHVCESLGDAYSSSDWATYFSTITNDLPDPEIESGVLKDVETGLYFEFVEIEDVTYTSIISDQLGVYTNDNLVKNTDGSYTFPTSVKDASGEGGDVTRIEESAFSGSSISGHLVIPAHILRIGKSAFKNCTGLTEVTYEYSATAIAEENEGSSSGAVDITFEGCSNIATVNLNRNITLKSSTRHVSPFEYINGVTKVTIGENVTEIPNFFVRNTSTNCLAEVYCYPTSVPSTSYDPFGNFTSCTLYVPKGLKETYSSASYASRSYTGDNATTWGEFFTNIEEMEGDDDEGTPLADGEKFEADGIYYNVVSGEGRTIEVTWGGEKNSSGTSTYTGELTIPSEVTYDNVTYTVIGLGDSAFRNCTTLTGITLPETLTYMASSYAFYATAITSITIPESVTEIGDYAFYNCTKLASVSLPQGITSLSKYTFNGCTSLTGITLPSGITSIGGYCFYQCTSLTEITLPSDLVTVDESAFNGCSGLTELVFPSKVESLGIYACQKCSKLEKVTLGEKLATIGNYAFKDCTSLTAIELPTAVESTLGQEVFNGCTALKTVTLGNATSIGNKAFYGCTALEEIKLPDVLATLGTEVFSGCTSVKKVDTGNGLTAISNKTFYNCTSLEELTLGTSIASIGQYAFYHCDGLTELTIPDNVTSLDQYVFQYCVGLEKVTFGAGLTALPIEGFRGCSSLTEAKITENITSIGNTTFKECTSLKEFVIPDNVTSIGTYVFQTCTGLESISLGSGLTAISQGAFNDCSALTEVVIPEGVTSIGSSAFYGCKNLVSVNIPDGVTTIAASCFRDCSSLPVVDIPESVTSLGNYAFYNCSTLTEVVIPSQMLSIGKQAFDGCVKMVEVYSLNATPPTCDVSSSTCAFSDETKAGVLYVPDGAKEAYEEAGTWQDFYAIVEMTELAVETLEATDITETSATLNGKVVEGYLEITEKGFEYWTEGGEVESVTVAEGELTATVTELAQNTKYTFRAYGTTSAGTTYGEELDFTTLEDSGDPTGINGIRLSIDDENVEGIYSVSGQKLNTTVKGVNIVRYADGSVKKIYVK